MSLLLALHEALHNWEREHFILHSYVKNGCDKVHTLRVAQLLILLSVCRQDIEDRVLTCGHGQVKVFIGESAWCSWYIFLYLAKDLAHIGLLFTTVIEWEPDLRSIKPFELLHSLLVSLTSLYRLIKQVPIVAFLVVTQEFRRDAETQTIGFPADDAILLWVIMIYAIGEYLFYFFKLNFVMPIAFWSIIKQSFEVDLLLNWCLYDLYVKEFHLCTISLRHLKRWFPFTD